MVEEITPYTFKRWIWLCIGVSLVGLAVSAHLALSHYYNFTNFGYRSFCAISQSLNCDTVSQSNYAIFLRVPLGVWGAVGYLFFLVIMGVLFPGKNRKNLQAWAGWLFVLASIFSGVSLVLAGISTFKIRSYCLMCILLYGVNFMLVYVSWLIWKRAGGGEATEFLKNGVLFFKGRTRRIMWIGACFFFVSGSLVLFYPKYWRFPEIAPDIAVNSGVTNDGSPWIGAVNPILTIEEYADYMCFQCGKMHTHLRQLINRYPDKIRLVHRHFPLDNKVNPVVTENVHPNSGVVALFAIAAQNAGVFWQTNDLLFRDAREKKEIHFKAVAEKVGLDARQLDTMIYNKKNANRLEADIRSGIRAGITATPSYVVDGKVYAGTIPEHILRPALR